MKKFAPGWRMTAFVIVMLPLLLSLGYWQVQRGALKRDLENQYLEKLTQLPRSISTNMMSQPFQALKLNGRYQPETFLVDNQISSGRTGYWVFQVFDDTTIGRVLINRGFIASTTRDQLPQVPTPSETLVLVATVWPELGLIPAWGPQKWSAGWPKRIQRVNVARMAAAGAAWPAELRLEAGQAGVLEPAPFASRLSDDKHRGYAATWFGLAIALVFGYLFLGVSATAKLQSAKDDDLSDQ
jgi:surfeit locus 1 family protein